MPIFSKLVIASNGKSKVNINVMYYIVAFVGVVAAAALRFALGPVLGGLIPVVFFTVPVAVSAFYGGFGPAMFATAFSTLIATYFFIPPYYSFQIQDVTGVVAISVFLVIGFIISLLGKRLQDLQTQTKQQAQALAEENKRKDEFLAMLAHELRNPLAGISTAAELLKFVHSDEKRLVKTSEVIMRQVKHMSNLVDDLLDVSRLTRGLVIINKHPVDMNDVVRGAIEQTQSLFDDKTQQLIVQMPSEPAYVYGDYTRLLQVVANLLGNAAKYTPKNGQTMLTVQIDANQVHICVRDNGLGIASELLPHVFEPFVQEKRTADRAQGGLGLGLALVQKITQLHNGFVTAHSEGVGQGSTFIFRLPHWKKAVVISEPNTVQEEHPRGEPKGMMQALTLMVVDDNGDAALGLGTLLENQGHTVFLAYSAKQALDLAHSDNFDAFFLDIGLPDVDGYELLRLLRLIPHVSAATFIALTGYGRSEDKEQSEATGFHYHFVKPISTAELAKVLSRVRPMS